MNRKELTKTFMMLLIEKKPFCLHDLYNKFTTLRIKHESYGIDVMSSSEELTFKLFFKIRADVNRRIVEYMAQIQWRI